MEIAQGFQESEDIRTGDLGSRGVQHIGDFRTLGIFGPRGFQASRSSILRGF